MLLPSWSNQVQTRKKAEKVKLGKFKSLHKVYYIVPFAVETLGAVGFEDADLGKSLGKSIQGKTGEKRSSFYLFLAGRRPAKTYYYEYA